MRQPPLPKTLGCIAGSSEDETPVVARAPVHATPHEGAPERVLRLLGAAEVRGLPVVGEHVSADGTVKWLFDVGGGIGGLFAANALGIFAANFANSRLVERLGTRLISQAAVLALQ